MLQDFKLMRIKFFILLFTLLSLNFTAALSQNRKAPPDSLTGRVLSAKDNKPVIGTNILVKGTSRGAATDANGYFSLQIAANEVMIINCIGYKKKVVKYKGDSNIIIYLEPKTEKLEEL